MNHRGAGPVGASIILRALVLPVPILILLHEQKQAAGSGEVLCEPVASPAKV